jgi:hypothetical protein
MAGARHGRYWQHAVAAAGTTGGHTTSAVTALAWPHGGPATRAARRAVR